jgi:hypothetical protein
MAVRILQLSIGLLARSNILRPTKSIKNFFSWFSIRPRGNFEFGTKINIVLLGLKGKTAKFLALSLPSQPYHKFVTVQTLNTLIPVQMLKRISS